MKIKVFASLCFFGAVLAPAAAQADTIVWKDRENGFTMSYPDSWTVQTADTPDTRLRVAGPLGEDHATCRLKVLDDGRAKIYPKEQVDEAVSEYLGPDYWQDEIAEYDGAQITAFYDPAALGDKGDATAVGVTFLQNETPMRGVMLASLYEGKRYVAACASKEEVYGRWSPVFFSVLDSVQIDSRYHPFATGYYRDFLSDPKLHLPRSKPGTTKESNNLSLWQRLFAGNYYK